MSVHPLEDVWEVRGLPVVAGEQREAEGGGLAGRVAVIRRQRFARLEQERRREMRLVETRIEQAAVGEARRMDKLLGYGEDDLVRWKRRIEPHHFNTYSAADFTTLMDDLHAIYRARREIISDCFSRQMSLEAERTARLRDVFKKYHPLLTRAFHKMPAEVEEQLELEAVALNEMVLNNLRQYTEIRFNRLTGEVRDKQRLKGLWKVRRDAWRTLNLIQAEKHLSRYLQSVAVSTQVEAPLAEPETSMATVWRHYREHVTGLPDLFVKQVTDEAVDGWQDQAYEILNSMSTMVTTHCKSYRKLYLDLENAWYRELDSVGDDLVSREVTDVDDWESLADRHTAAMFGPIRDKVESSVSAAQQCWAEVVKAAPGQIDHLYNYIASSCEVFSLHLAERVRYAKKLELQLQAVDSQQAVKESQLEQKTSKTVAAMTEESRAARVHQLQQTLAKQMTAFLPTYEQLQERRLQLLLGHSERLEAETLTVQASVAEKLEAAVTSPEAPPPEPPEDCHRLMVACRGVLLSPAELSELQSLSAANIRWFLSWERRTLQQDLGDFLMDKLKTLKAAFNSKVEGVAERISEIERTVHDRRSSEIQLHQQRVDSHCRSVHDELKWIQSEQASELESLRCRLDEERSWLTAHEHRSRSAGRSYVLQMMLSQISEREARFVDALVERSAAFRRRVEEFSAGLVGSTRSFLRQLVPQPPPEPPPGSRPGSLTVGSRATSVRVAVLRQQARRASRAPQMMQPQTPGSAARRQSVMPSEGSSVRRQSVRPSEKRGSVGRGAGQGKEVAETEEGGQQLVVGNFSQEEVVKYKATLKKLLATIDQTVKVHCKSLEHRMELVCAGLDEAIKKAEGSIRAQIVDVQFSETMQRCYVSISTLIRTEMHLNQEEIQATKRLIRGLTDQLDDYERRWAVNMRRESQLSVYFQPSGTVQWEEQTVGLSGCILEGTAALRRVEEIFQQICARHSYLYYEQLNGTVSFCVDSPEGGSESGIDAEETEPTPSASALPSAGGSTEAVVLPSADGGATVRLDDSAARQSLLTPTPTPQQTRRGRDSASGASSSGTGGRRASGTGAHGGRGRQGRGTADRASISAARSDSRETFLSEETAATEGAGSSGYTADVSASAETATAPTTAATATPGKTEKRRGEKKKAAISLSKMEEAEVIVFLFGSVDRPTEANNFIEKVQRKILTVLQETRETANAFYQQKGGRAMTRPDLVPATYEDLLGTVFARFQACYTESTQYQRVCFADFCEDFAVFARAAARIPALLFRHQSELFCRQVAAVSRDSARELADQRRRWAETAAGLERQLRPALGHPNQHPRLFSLVELTVDRKETHLGCVKRLDAACSAARTQLQEDFDRSTAFLTARCRSALLSLTSASHLSAGGLSALTGLLTEAVERPAEACRADWAAERHRAEAGWGRALREAETECRRWTENWFSGVETVQQLYGVCWS